MGCWPFFSLCGAGCTRNPRDTQDTGCCSILTQTGSLQTNPERVPMDLKQGHAHLHSQRSSGKVNCLEVSRVRSVHPFIIGWFLTAKAGPSSVPPIHSCKLAPKKPSGTFTQHTIWLLPFLRKYITCYQPLLRVKSRLFQPLLGFYFRDQSTSTSGSANQRSDVELRSTS